MEDSAICVLLVFNVPLMAPRVCYWLLAEWERETRRGKKSIFHFTFLLFNASTGAWEWRFPMIRVFCDRGNLFNIEIGKLMLLSCESHEEERKLQKEKIGSSRRSNYSREKKKTHTKISSQVIQFSLNRCEKCAEIFFFSPFSLVVFLAAV